MSLPLLGAGPSVDGAAPPALELNPDPNFALGTSGWVGSNGTVIVNTGSIDLVATAVGQGFAPAAGAPLIAYVAAIPDSTALVVRIMVTNFVSGVVRARLKGGTAVDLTDMGGGLWQGIVTSGTSAVQGLQIVGSGLVGSTFRITQFSIKAS